MTCLTGLMLCDNIANINTFVTSKQQQKAIPALMVQVYHDTAAPCTHRTTCVPYITKSDYLTGVMGI